MSADCVSRDLMPGDREVEQALICLALLDADAAKTVAQVPASAWWLADHRVAAESIAGLLDEGIGRIDRLVLADAIRRRGCPHPSLEDLAGWEADLTPSLSLTSHYLEIVLRHARHRDVIGLADRLTAAALAGDDARIAEIVAAIDSRVSE